MSDAYQTFLAGETLPAGRLQDLGQQGTYTPALQATTTNPTLGTGAIQLGDYHLRNGFVRVGFTIQFGTSGVAAGTGFYLVTLPPGLGLHADWQDNRDLGTAFARDNSASSFYHFFIRTSSSNADVVRFDNTASPTVGISSTNPMTWAADDYLRGSFEYKTDFT